ncbi:hypothetical protein AMAG_04734 [Allomyces macrogynus ATCC 38327]|uniref:protein-tyrosine-phosphatase n=1 Tax=Allomyces macrogynus (strain ATCC 38327) TaxID=578462 RepID=A0A0L0S6A2_ALLM3|nr:hypothetical protein AMAG_04734 [Allomyces macrogynus ATCC 38327]|eukprot:KNE57889.1 hypothetical protein AMAG_04734 [Allomyces macrogynus ATCC 38327]
MPATLTVANGGGGASPASSATAAATPPPETSRSASPTPGTLPPTTLAALNGSTGGGRIATPPAGGSRLYKPLTPIEYRGLRFLVMDAPSDTNLPQYIRELERHQVTDVVRACEPTYSGDVLESHGIKIHELNFKDGDPPPATIVSQWLGLVAAKFVPKNTKVHCPRGTIAVHCVAGLGRAPVLVAIALIEAGMPNLEAVEYIRSRRRGALNMKQIHFLDSYKRRGKGKLIGACGGGAGDAASGDGARVSPIPGKDKDKCTIM